MNESKKEGFRFGAKLVRGAYMEQERLRAKEFGYEDPIQPDFNSTSKNYEINLTMCMNEIKIRQPGTIKVLAASHNEETVKYAVKKLERNFN